MTKPADAPRLDDWMTATEVATALGVSRQAVNQMIQAGQFASLHKIGPETRPQYLVTRAEVDRMVSQRRSPRPRTA